MTEAPLVYKFDEDGYFIRAKYAQESPCIKGKFLIPKRSTQIKPEIPEGFFGRFDGEKREEVGGVRGAAHESRLSEEGDRA